jgi:ATP-dependent RNA helicase DDX46/PRP5
VIDEDNKYLKLLELLGIYQEQGSVIVFVDKQEHADDLTKRLLKNSYPCMALHGGVDQCDRESIMSFFKSSNMPLLIATSIAARGLDVKDLILVVNYDCPNHYEDYVHRCGRTGRAGNKGFAYTFITPEQSRYAGHILKALELSGTAVPDELFNLWNEYVKEMEAVSEIINLNFSYQRLNYIYFTLCSLARKSKLLREASKARATSSISKKRLLLMSVRNCKSLHSACTWTVMKKMLMSM